MEFIATITKVNNSNEDIFGVYVNFNNGQTGFIPVSQLQLKNKQVNAFKNGKVPDNLQVGKQIKVQIIRTDGEYTDLKVV